MSSENFLRLSPDASGHHGAIGPIPDASAIKVPERSRVNKNGAFKRFASVL